LNIGLLMVFPFFKMSKNAPISYWIYKKSSM